MKKIFFFLFVFLIGKNVCAQDTISLRNASFEWGSALANSIPKGWEICSRPTETPPDVHSSKTRHYGVDHAPKFGKKYIGLVVRSNFTYESIHQKLKKPLNAGKEYRMHFYVAMSDSFKSHDSKTMEKMLFTQPAIVRIWGVEQKCETKELLFESEVVDHSDWKRLEVKFFPKMKHDRILIEAFYGKMIDEPYNGNVLIDAFSDIVEVK